MVRKTLKAISAKIGGLHKAAFWLASFSIFSQVLAFFRDRLLAHHFGAGETLDIYYTVFRIPDFIFVTVGSLVSISVLIPMFSKKAAAGDEGVKSYLNSIFTSFSVLVIASCALAFVFMPQLANAFFRGFDAAAMLEIIKFSRILLLSPLLLGLSNFFGSIVQYEKRFLLYSLSPLLYNGGIIAGLVLGAERFGISAVVSGVIFGAVLHLAAPLSYIVFSGNVPKLTSRVDSGEVRETALVSIPRALALSFTQLISIVFTAIASFFGAGSVAVLNLAFNLGSMPLSVVGASYSLAAFPTLSEHYAKNSLEECGRYIGESLRYIIFLTLPLSALFIILRTHIVRVVLGSGAFDWTDTRLTAAVLALFALSFMFQSSQLFLTRAHYALGKTKQPLFWGFAGALFTVCLAAVLYFGVLAGALDWVESFLEIGGLVGSRIIILPIAFSLGSALTALGLWSSLDKKAKEVAGTGLAKSFSSSLAASTVVGVVTFYSLRVFDSFWTLDSLLGVFGHAFVSGTVGIAAGAGFLYLIGNREMKEISAKLAEKLWKTKISGISAS